MVLLYRVVSGRCLPPIRRRLALFLLPWCMAAAHAARFSETQAISIPSSGSGAPYPSRIAVSGIAGSVSGVVVTLHGLGHDRPEDLDLLLVGPGGQSVVLMSDVPGPAVSHVTLAFSDNGGGEVPNPITSGTYYPTDWEIGAADVFPAPAPSSPRGYSITELAAAQANGNWSLYVVDDTSGSVGQVAGGWSLDLCLTSDPATELRYEGWRGYALPGEVFTAPMLFDAVNGCSDLVTSFSGPVTVALKPGSGAAGATLSGTTTVDTVNGRASFGDLRIDKAGPGYVLQASAPGLSTADSAPFIVSPPLLYVKPASVGGSDTADGLSWDTARSSLAGAMAVTGGGSEVWIEAGTYPTSIVALKPAVHLLGGFAGSESSKDHRNWHENRTVLDGGAKMFSLRAIPGGSTVVDGFTLQNAGVGSSAVILGIPNSQIEVHNCTFVGNSGSAITAYGAARLSNNLIMGCQQPAVALLADTSVLENNTISGNAVHGVYASWSSDPQPNVTLRNNIITGNRFGIFRTNTGVVMTLSHNDVYGNSQADYLGLANPTGVNGNISADPFFANAPSGDFRLSEGSICIDAGDDALALPAVLDLDARQRKVGTRIDIGAYEYIPPGAITWNDLVQALKMAGGLVPATTDDLARLDAVSNGAAFIDLSDTVRLAQKVAGLEPNP